MRIAILGDPLDNQQAGVHVYTREMVRALVRTNPGHELILVRERKGNGLNGVRQVAVPNVSLPVGIASMRLFFLLPLLLRRMGADVVIEPAHFGPFNLPRRIKRVTIIHDLTPILFPDLHRWHSQVLQRTFLGRILRRADLVIANSDNTRADLEKLYPFTEKKTCRIYPGPDDSFRNESNPATLQKFGIGEDFFLFAGTIEPRKNLEALLEAFRYFKEETGADTQLVIAGGRGWKYKSFFNRLKAHPFGKQIICTGYVSREELRELYSDALALIYPSRYEGFGFPVVEAMRCGCPVLAADNSSLPEVGGDAASYFDAADAKMMARLMGELHRDGSRREAMSAKGLEEAAKFSWDAYAAEFWRAIEKL